MNFNSSGHMLLLFLGKAFDWSIDKMKASEPNMLWSEELKYNDPISGPRFKTKTKFWTYVPGGHKRQKTYLPNYSQYHCISAFCKIFRKPTKVIQNVGF